MEELKKLINEWASFVEKNQKGTVEDFCKYFLARSERRMPEKSRAKPPDPDGHFMKVIMRFAQSYALYARIALKDTPMPDSENFVFLAASRSMGESRRTDLINFVMVDLSTGSDILNRLVRDAYLRERGDPADKRSKLISITVAGEKVLRECFRKTVLARKIFLKGLSSEDKRLCVLILEPLEVRHSVLSVESKNKTIEEIAEEMEA